MSRLDLHNRVENDFNYHQPTDEKVTAHQLVREKCVDLAHDLINTVPEGRELSLALTSLEQVMMWANAGIARNE